VEETPAEDESVAPEASEETNGDTSPDDDSSSPDDDTSSPDDTSPDSPE
jgi:hypothetical protein